MKKSDASKLATLLVPNQGVYQCRDSNHHYRKKDTGQHDTWVAVEIM